MSFTSWILNKLWYIQYSMEYYSLIARYELSSYKNTLRNCKYMLLSTGSQSEKTTHYMIPTMWHIGKDKIIKTIKRSVVARGSGRGSDFSLSLSLSLFLLLLLIYNLWQREMEAKFLNLKKIVTSNIEMKSNIGSFMWMVLWHFHCNNTEHFLTTIICYIAFWSAVACHHGSLSDIWRPGASVLWSLWVMKKLVPQH